MSFLSHMKNKQQSIIESKKRRKMANKITCANIVHPLLFNFLNKNQQTKEEKKYNSFAQQKVNKKKLVHQKCFFLAIIK